jgi:mannose-6-phosphate isomerase-like protein (cupin superfamily)
MKTNYPFHILSAVVLLLVIALSLQSYAQQNPPKFAPRLIPLDRHAASKVQLFAGPPETVTMRSGYMVLAPSKSVGTHSTKTNEEILVVLAGQGEMKMTEGPTLQLQGYSVAYCPPNTEHDVRNVGSDTLRYVYIVASAIK